MQHVIAIFPLLGALAAAVQVYGTHQSATGAPQQAAGMAMACAYAIVPYVFARSIEMATPAEGPWRQRIGLVGVVLGIAVILATVPMLPTNNHELELQRARELDALDKLTR